MKWRQTGVVIRADILDQAYQQKIDISETCNRALAERLGIDYRQQKIPEGIVPEPVIIAANGKPVLSNHGQAKPGESEVPAIINADDPQAAKTIKSRHLPKVRNANGTARLLPRKKRPGPSIHRHPLQENQKNLHHRGRRKKMPQKNSSHP